MQRAAEPAWHRRLRRQRAADRVLCCVAAAAARLADHHGSSPPVFLRPLLHALRPAAPAATRGASSGAAQQQPWTTQPSCAVVGGLAFAPGAASARSRLQASGAEHLQSVADRALAEARARAELAVAAEPEPARPHSELAVACGTEAPQAPLPAAPAATTAAALGAAGAAKKGGKDKDSGKKGDKGKKGKDCGKGGNAPPQAPHAPHAPRAVTWACSSSTLAGPSALTLAFRSCVDFANQTVPARLAHMLAVDRLVLRLKTYRFVRLGCFSLAHTGGKGSVAPVAPAPRGEPVSLQRGDAQGSVFLMPAGTEENHSRFHSVEHCPTCHLCFLRKRDLAFSVAAAMLRASASAGLSNVPEAMSEDELAEMAYGDLVNLSDSVPRSTKGKSKGLGKSTGHGKSKG